MTLARYALVSLAVLVAVALVAFLVPEGYFDFVTARHYSPEASHRPLSVERTGTLGRSLRESSGIAVSRRHPGVLWTHNDSGDGPNVYAIDLEGTLLGRFRVRKASSRDWEDIALGPCPQPATHHCLYVAETGDNDRHRSRYRVLTIAEPEIRAGRAQVRDTVDLVQTVQFTYPDGAHDAEALGVTPDGRILVVTKGRSGTVSLFELPVHETGEPPKGPDPIVVVARRLADLPITPNPRIGRLVTGGAVAPDRQVMVIRTYAEVYVIDLTATPPRLAGQPCFVGSLARGGEAIDFYDDRRLVLTSETLGGIAGPIHLVECP